MSTEIPPPRSQSEAIQILATEHWSLLATRALTYQESLGRVNMFLTILSGAVIALALVAQADRFGPAFISIAIFMLAVVFVVGFFTVARLLALNRDVRGRCGFDVDLVAPRNGRIRPERERQVP